MISWLFPGQGSQFVGMGADLASPAARETFDRAEEVLGWDLRAVCTRGPEERLNSTDVTQPAVFTVAVAATRTLNDLGAAPDLVAGHSVGEFAALVAAGAASFEEMLRVVAVRAAAMRRAARTSPGGMAAVIGLSVEHIEAVCAHAGGEISVANVNGPDQVVISGEEDALARAATLARADGARRVIRLSVSVAAHSPLMAAAKHELAAALADVTWRPATVPVASGATGRLHQRAEEFPDLLATGLTSPVRWEGCVQSLVAAGTELFVEVGPGSVLSGLVRRIASGIPTTQAGDDAACAAFVKTIGDERRAGALSQR